MTSDGEVKGQEIPTFHPKQGFAAKGDMTILGTTKPVSLAVEHTGFGKGRFGDARAGFEVNGKINRKDFGLQFHLLNEAGDLIVGDEVKIQCEIALLRK